MALVPEIIENSIIRIVSPLVRIMLRNGIAYGAFVDIVRKIYVEAGFHEVKRRDLKATISNVSIVTGLNRKEVKRLKGALSESPDHSLKKFNRIVRVLAGWQHDQEFLDQQHEPRDLQLDGERGSFTSLVRRYSGDMPVVAMLNSLLSSGNIQVIDNGNIQLVNGNYLPQTDSEQKLNILGIDTAELIETIDHNLRASNNDDLWFQRKASNTRVNPRALTKIRQRIRRKAQQLLEDIDADFSANESDSDADATSVSIGIYYWQTDEEPTKGSEK
jgi:hypothetical protein